MGKIPIYHIDLHPHSTHTSQTDRQIVRQTRKHRLTRHLGLLGIVPVSGGLSPAGAVPGNVPVCKILLNL